MKKFIICLAFSVSLATMPACKSETKDKEDKELALEEVPMPVKSAFSEKYSTAVDVKWEAAKEDGAPTYKAKFTVDGKKMKAEYDSTGIMLKEDKDK